eukprot:jgi/Ulvmu1/767/UM010_0141.1
MRPTFVRAQRIATHARFAGNSKASIVQQAKSISAVAAFEFVKTPIGDVSIASRQVKNHSILDWARQASMGCELAPKEAPEGLELGTFLGGCFWGLELAFQRVPGVTKTSVGYTGGQTENPTYEAVCSGRTGHAEAVQVTYNPKEVTFNQLLEAFAAQTDVTTLNRQGNDRGTMYRSGVYYHNEEQKEATEAYFNQLNEEIKAGKWPRFAGDKVVAEVRPAGDFYNAEEYHQQYLSKGGRMGMAQSAEKGCTDKIRCYG